MQVPHLLEGTLWVSAGFPRPIWMISMWSLKNRFGKMVNSQKKFEVKRCFNFVVVTVPADALAPSGARASASTVMIMFWLCLCAGPAPQGLIICYRPIYRDGDVIRWIAHGGRLGKWYKTYEIKIVKILYLWWCFYWNSIVSKGLLFLKFQCGFWKSFYFKFYNYQCKSFL